MWGGLNLFGRQGKERQQQISTLQKRVSGAHIAAEDGSLIDVTFVIDSEEKSMRVFLPPRFPVDKPVLQLMQATRHSCVDKYNQVNVPYLANWTPANSLADLVETVVEMLEKGEDDAEDATRGEDVSVEAAVEEVTVAEEEEAHVFECSMPEIPEAFGEVEEMTEAEAKKIAESDVDFEEFFESIQAVRSVRELRDSLRKSNEKLAKDILADREGFESTRAEALSVRQNLTEALEKYNAQQRRAVELCPRDTEGDAVRFALDRADDADALSETINDDFRSTSRNMTLQQWHQAFLAARLDYHRNAAMAHVFKQDEL